MGLTAQEKAKDLVDKFYCGEDSLGLMFCINYSNAKQCAIIAVDEILKSNANSGIVVQVEVRKYQTWSAYWDEVKHEIEKL